MTKSKLFNVRQYDSIVYPMHRSCCIAKKKELYTHQWVSNAFSASLLAPLLSPAL